MAMSLSLAVTAGAANLSDYSDSDKVTAKYATAVDFASQLGILEGFDDGKYHPQGTLTRAQLATMVYRMTTADVADVYTANFAGGAAEAFSDTAATAWYAGYVGYAADAELLKGLGDGTYAPNDALTGYAALAAFLRGVGYDEPGHNFVGADWTVEVAKVAKQAGVLTGITNVDLNKPITREVAAQMIYNIMFSDMVAYTPAFGYQSIGLLGAGDTLAKDEFYIVSDKDGDAANVAPWGRPATIWVADDGSDVTAAVTIEATPVAEYTVAVDDCSMAKDLGLTKDEKDVVVFENGSKDTSDTVIDVTNTAKTNGGQGTLTEVYLVDGDYQIVKIETWMAEVTDVVKATFDKKGHEIAPAKTTLTAWDNENVADPKEEDTATFYAETEAFAEEAYVLMNNSWFTKAAGTVTVDMPGNDEDVVYIPELEAGVDTGVLNITVATPVATGELTAYNNTAKTSTIGGTTYDWAQKFGLGFKGTVGTTYDVYVDFYGNVIGIEVPAKVFTYGIVTKMAWADSYLPLDDADTYANILDFGANASTNVAMDSYLTRSFSGVGTAANGELSATVNEKTVATVSTNAANNTAYYDAAYKFETLSDGSVAIVDVQNQNQPVNIVKEQPTKVATSVNTNDNTVYLVKTGNATDGYTYTTYTGYKTIPSMTNVKVDYFVADNYVSYMYVDATAATFTGSTEFAYIFTGANDGEEGDLYVYDIFVGTENKEKLHADDTLTGFEAAGLYDVTYNAAGEIVSVKYVGHIATFSGNIYCDGTVIEDANGQLNVTEVPVYVVDKANGEVAVGDYEDVETKSNAWVVVDEDDNTKALAIYIDK